ncbi:MAG: class I SAM-dependent methyltransferase [Pseudomonadota bacterium]
MGFDPEWLALREPADHAARDATLLRQAADIAGPSPLILDLACGTGSNLRAFSQHIAEDALWRLVDNDRGLLDVAKAQASDTVEIFEIDISDPEDLPLNEVTLVAASALLDLVAASWLRAMVATLRARDLPFYAALSYDGRMNWTPDLEEDARVTNAFNTHQRTDKGFGPALGPDAVPLAKELFIEHGFSVNVAQSDWKFAPGADALKDVLMRDVTQAAEEAGYCATDAWRQRSASRALSIGHLDLLALPPGCRSN